MRIVVVCKIQWSVMTVRVQVPLTLHLLIFKKYKMKKILFLFLCISIVSCVMTNRDAIVETSGNELFLAKEIPKGFKKNDMIYINKSTKMFSNSDNGLRVRIVSFVDDTIIPQPDPTYGPPIPDSITLSCNGVTKTIPYAYYRNIDLKKPESEKQCIILSQWLIDNMKSKTIKKNKNN